jgi:hypothetical protein
MRRYMGWLVGAVCFAAIVVAILPRVFVDPARVDRVTFVNHTVYAAEVEVTDAQRSGWLRLGTAERGATTSMTRVVDQGDEWIFRFGAQGLDGGELRMTKSDLIRSQWEVVIAEPIAKRLAQEGAAPSPIRNAQ